MSKEVDDAGNQKAFMDETWVNKNHPKLKLWTDGTLQSCRKIRLGNGDRLIITHAGNGNDFIPGVLNIFWSNSGKADYHQDMDSTYFERWFVDQFLPSLEEPTVIIMDNGKYHSRR